MVAINTAFQTAITGLQFQETNLAIKAQNIAAQGVGGYKKEYLVGMTLGYQDHTQPGTPTSENGTIVPTGLQVGIGVQPAGTYRSFSEGDPIKTGEPLDLMILGQGFFIVTLPDGTSGYTRVGALQKNATGQLVMPKTGYVISPGITIPQNATEISITPQGQVFVLTPGSTTPNQIGQIQLATFINPSGLQGIEDSIFQETSASGTPNTGNPGGSPIGILKQGWLEGSNVDAVREMTDLIKIEKIYDMLTKVIKTGDSMLEATTRIRT